MGSLLNPIDPDDEDRDWIRELWRFELARALGGNLSAPGWLERPAVGRITISKPTTREPFQELNAGKPFAEQIKPFNFLLTCQVASFGHPADVDPEHFQLIAPWEPDRADGWSSSGSTSIQTRARPTGSTPKLHSAWRASPKSLATATFSASTASIRSQRACHRMGNRLAGMQTGCWRDALCRGRRIIHIGKESNELEDIQAGTVHDPDEVLNEHVREMSGENLSRQFFRK